MLCIAKMLRAYPPSQLHGGGQRLAILYSFAATCKANGICFSKWLEDVLLRLTTTPVGEIDSLIPKGEAKSSMSSGSVL